MAEAQQRMGLSVTQCSPSFSLGLFVACQSTPHEPAGCPSPSFSAQALDCYIPNPFRPSAFREAFRNLPPSVGQRRIEGLVPVALLARVLKQMGSGDWALSLSEWKTDDMVEVMLMIVQHLPKSKAVCVQLLEHFAARGNLHCYEALIDLRDTAHVAGDAELLELCRGALLRPVYWTGISRGARKHQEGMLALLFTRTDLEPELDFSRIPAFFSNRFFREVLMSSRGTFAATAEMSCLWTHIEREWQGLSVEEKQAYAGISRSPKDVPTAFVATVLAALGVVAGEKGT